MSSFKERHEQERQMEVEMKIRSLRIHRLEHKMAYDLEPFGPEFEDAAEKLRKLKEEQYAAGVKKSNFHSETARMERAAAQAEQAAEAARKEAEGNAAYQRLSALKNAKAEPEL